jgi:sugar lactone lactonase YvrE
MRRYTAEPVTEVRAEHAEGPAWDTRRDELLWVDQFAGLVHRGRVGSDGVLQVVRTYQVGSAVGAVVPVAAEGGGWLIAAGAGFAYLSPEGGVTVLAEPETAVRERNRMNDGKCDPAGRFYAGSMAWSKQPGAGSLYRYAANGGIATVLDDVTISNGLAWHGGGDRMYYIDTPTQRVDVFDLNDAGEPVTRRTAFTVDPAHGAPDGMSIDDEDCLWVALWGSGTLRRYAPSGETLAIVDVPGAPQVSSCAFAGTTLYVTTSQEDYPPALRLRHHGAGQIFAVGLPVGGPPAAPYRG